MEIERKYLIRQLPFSPESYPFHLIQQAYLNTDPVIRIRREDNSYYLTYKSKGLMVREEYNLPLTAEAYEHLLPKADGNLISKKRYLIPLSDGLTAELDVFDAPFDPLCLAEVEFPDETAARRFTPPDWFGQEVTFSTAYHNSTLSRLPRESLVDKSFLLSNSTTL
ncbi:CYTH domain-containing protein [Oscillospiraceae bacterium Marseille-Q3528]|nr:CYTH domain-containing protein [Oscillospiraceae bacterium Marseille-Q3528]WNV58794.1 CYTH domain-containing protein [Oscillospiraceae bacterium NTUH-002-81]